MKVVKNFESMQEINLSDLKIGQLLEITHVMNGPAHLIGVIILQTNKGLITLSTPMYDLTAVVAVGRLFSKGETVTLIQE